MPSNVQSQYLGLRSITDEGSFELTAGLVLSARQLPAWYSDTMNAIFVYLAEYMGCYSSILVLSRESLNSPVRLTLA